MDSQFMSFDSSKECVPFPGRQRISRHPDSGENSAIPVESWTLSLKKQWFQNLITRNGSGALAASGTVTADADGYVPVALRCDRPVQCRGALLVDLSADTGAKDVGGTPISTPVGRGRSDLVVNAGATRTIGAPVPGSAIAYL
jgi:hypothetical protein